MPLDIFDHDDGVVDHDADREHETEQREIVDRKAERGHRREGANQRHRDRDDRDDGRTPSLQEDEHEAPDLKVGKVVQGCRLHALALDVGAVERADVGYLVEAANAPDGGVPRVLRLALFEGGHIPPMQGMMRETLEWLDKYLGPVGKP